MLNKVMVIGRLGQDPALKYSQVGEVPIATFSVATSETYIDRDGVKQQRTEWFRVVVFQRMAENCSRYLHKGSLVYVEGSLQSRKWTDQQGVERTMVEVKAQKVVFLDKKEYGPGDQYGQDGGGYGDADHGPNRYGDGANGSYAQDARYQGQQNRYQSGTSAGGFEGGYGEGGYGNPGTKPAQSQGNAEMTPPSEMDNVPF